MGFSYLDGKFWRDVTREERFFCQQLYRHIEAGPQQFVAYLHDTHGLGVAPDGEWEAGFEVCFYRDLWQHRGRTESLFSPKRTFDLCLFGERAMIIIEAKAVAEFHPDQNDSFAQDIAEVRRLTGLSSVHLVGLCSSKYAVDRRSASLFAAMLRWDELATHYGDDAVLRRANEVYEPKAAFAASGRYSDEKLSGAALLDAARGGATWWVGRQGGLHGKRFQQDVATGQWRVHRYEVSTTATERPSPRYFSLADFAQAVGTAGVDQKGTT